jgi:GNAT superfamily N-acetyltransferase
MKRFMFSSPMKSATHSGTLRTPPVNGPATFDRLPAVEGAELYADNAAAMWVSLAPWSRPVPGTAPGVAAVDLPAQRGGRVILRWRGAAGSRQPVALVRALGLHGRVVVEDSFGDLAPRRHGIARDAGVTVDRMPLMLRPAGSGPPGNSAAVVHVTDQESLVQAERVIVDGFPRPALQPYRPGRMLPPWVLATPGWRTWLAYRHGRPAAACCTYDDGATLGVYWLAVLPEHRSAGLGRAIMCAALAASPGRPAVLVATAVAVPLYSSLGFAAVAEAVWYRIQA